MQGDSGASGLPDGAVLADRLVYALVVFALPAVVLALTLLALTRWPVFETQTSEQPLVFRAVPDPTARITPQQA